VTEAGRDDAGGARHGIAGDAGPDPARAADLAGATALDDLVAYQPGAVVSRTVVKKASGTVTAFAFDQGEGLSEHAAAYDALVLVTDGQAEVTVGGTAHLMSAGQLLRLPAGVPHALLALTRFKMLLVMIRE
jgi:quercetin dioxygenase-like cupin family protein